MESAQGQLLIAGPSLRDPNFWRTVVLIVEHSQEGALGLVLNRPSESKVDEAVPQLSTLVGAGTDVLMGGPVGQAAVIVLAEFANPDDAALIAFGNVGVLAGEGPGDAIGIEILSARVFAGHAGWGPGQLDDELERGDWILEPARYSDAFADDPGVLWTHVLQRKGGSYALLARMPADPSLN